MAGTKPRTLDELLAQPDRTDRARIVTTTEADIRRHMAEDDTPEWTDAEAAEARVVRRGRPPSASPKQATALRLDVDVLARLRASGPGWQSRVNQVLREWLDAPPAQPHTPSRSRGTS
jgi:uncharacterized protein (DUF4415 family)